MFYIFVYMFCIYCIRNVWDYELKVIMRVMN